MNRLICALTVLWGLLIINQSFANSGDPLLPESERPSIRLNTTQKEYVTKLFYAFDPVCQKYGINTKVAITQAIVEQGWTLREDFRIFNIMSLSKENSKLVYDNGEKRYRRYRVYENLQNAIEDYCKVLANYPTYRSQGLFNSIDPRKQIKAIVKGGYATNKNYEQLSLKVLYLVAPIVDELRTLQALGNQDGFKQEVVYGYSIKQPLNEM
ncbi:glucosaminidase domain-containing protein [Algivirga pacifica]|uniref:Mannosyl-glycoprotein endo-beta-N-acetylglucosamidase-like domain-containing protein n=1 Tax=Algivirga pacifica TaxID=1162670 RepID=A0ABP9CXC0_9BACT